MSNKGCTTKRYPVISVMLIYLFAVLSHIFFLTPGLGSTNHNHNSIFKEKIETAHPNNLVERAAKATFKETIKSRVAEVPLTYLDCPFISLHPNSPGVKINLLNNRHCFNSRHSYLSFCIFRI